MSTVDVRPAATGGLSADDVIALATIVGWVYEQARVSYVCDGRVVTGTLREFVNSPQDFRRFRGGDVRDAFVRVSLGTETAIPVAHLVHLLDRDEIAAR